MAEKPHLNFIGNRWVAPAGGAYLESINPATEEPIARFARSGAEDVDMAVQSAHAAMADDWLGWLPLNAAACCLDLPI